MNIVWYVYTIQTDKKNELFLCVIYRSPNSRDDDNKQLLDLLVDNLDNEPNILDITKATIKVEVV